MADPHLQPNGTLRNRLGISDPSALARAEAEYDHVQTMALFAGEPSAIEAVSEGFAWGLGRLKAIHKHLFGGIYDWAGTTRAEAFVDSAAKGRLIRTGFDIRKTGMKTAFEPSGAIVARMSSLEASIGDAAWLRRKKPLELAVVAADVLNVVNRIHPFREGNGRTQRAFVKLLVNRCGRDIDFGVVTARRMTLASQVGMEGDPDAMRRLMRDAMSVARVRTLHQVRKSYAASGVDWNNLYVGFSEPGRTLEGNVVDVVDEGSRRFIVRVDEGGVVPALVVGSILDLPLGDRDAGFGKRVRVTPKGRPTPRPSRTLGGRER